MRLKKLALIAAIACGIPASQASAQYDPFGIRPVSHFGKCDCNQPVCGCDVVDPSCDSDDCDGGCDSLCGGGGLGDPWKLFGDHGAWSVGGWTSLGYHTAPLANFNDYPNKVQLHQAWLYAEKAVDTSNGFDIGGRIDYLYGTDAQDTQAFGTDPRGWDNPWDHGVYGHALPQAYVEAGYGDLKVKVGHFFTIIGWEVVAAPDNFFYSHAYTMYNSEPFTHTGVLAEYALGEDTTIWGGYVFGWDSGFDDNGDAFLGGISQALTDDLTLTYATIIGRFGEARFNGVEKGYMHSLVADYSVTDKLQYIMQHDYLDTKDDADAVVRRTVGLNQYLIYNLNDNWAWGSRFEWWQVNAFGGDVIDTDVYSLTTGVNYRPNANLIFRPEVRYDWARGANNLPLPEDRRDQFVFGMDAIFLF